MRESWQCWDIGCWDIGCWDIGCCDIGCWDIGCWDIGWHERDEKDKCQQAIEHVLGWRQRSTHQVHCPNP
jgi:hypothetical protein